MARPVKEGMDYFPHDVDAVNDEKIEAMRTLYGNDGYAFYFIMLERIYRRPDLELPIVDAETRQILANKVAVTLEKFNSMLETALRWGLFDQQAYEERKVLTSNGIKKRAQPVIEKRRKMRDKKRKQSPEFSPEKTQQESDNESETTPIEKKSKVKKSKEEERRESEKAMCSETEHSTLSDPSTPRNSNENAKQVMDEYNRLFRECWKRPLQATPDRLAKVKARLKTFSVDDLVTAMENIRASRFHCGENDRGQVYATPEFIFRNDAQVDKWLKAKDARSPTGLNPNVARALELAEKYQREEEGLTDEKT